MAAWFRRQKPTGPLVAQVLKRLTADRTPVRVEIEQKLLRFTTRLKVRQEVVLVGKPQGLEAPLGRDDSVRFKIPWDPAHEVRMAIALPHLNLSNGMGAFCCKTPEGHAAAVQRHADRFSTRRFRNLHLEVPDLGEGFPIVDLSAAGCRIAAERGLQRALRLNRHFRKALIRLGDNLRVELVRLIPRVHLGEMVGLEFFVDRSSEHHGRLRLLLGSLAMSEQRLAPPEVD